METQFAPPAPHVQAFVQQLLNAGHTLISVVDNLTDALVENGSTREEAMGDLVVALMGAVDVRLASVPQADFARATELMELTVDAVIAELKRAERRSRRRERSAGRRRGHAAR